MTDSVPESTERSPATPRWEDVVDIYVAPAAVFERRRSAGFLLPALVVTVLMTVLYMGIQPLLQPIMDAEFQRGAARTLERSPQLTMEQLEQGRALMERFAPVFLLFTVPLTIIVTGLLLWVAGRTVEAKQALPAALMVAAYAQFPRVIEQVALGVQGILLNVETMVSRFQLSIGPARFVDPIEQAMMANLLARLDLFVIWVTVLLAIGLSVTGGITRGRAAIAALLVWLLGTLPAVWAAFQQ